MDDITSELQACVAGLEQAGCQYALYFRRHKQEPFYAANCERFTAASLIKVPILLAWAALERLAEVDQNEFCRLSDESPVHGAGLAWQMTTQRLTYHDVLLMMIALSDNFCTNLVISRIGLDRLNWIFRDVLELEGAELQRKLMDFAARERGRDNWITPNDCIGLYEQIRKLNPVEREWVDAFLLATVDDFLLKRDLRRDSTRFHHKTGSITGVLHDWGYTERCELFLLTQQVQDEPAIAAIFGRLGRLIE